MSVAIMSFICWISGNLFDGKQKQAVQWIINQKKIKNKAMQFQQEKPKEEQPNIHLYNTFDYNELVIAEHPSINSIQPQPSPHDSIYFIDQPHRRVLCLDCKKQIIRTTSILCGEQFRCVGCFAKLLTSQETFIIIKSLNYPVIDINWKANHQILFLNILEKFGFGNWKEIKDQMQFYGAKHSQQELRLHYQNCYLSQQDFLPKFVNNESFFQKRYDHISVNKHSSIFNPTTISSSGTAPIQLEQMDEYYANNISRRQTKFIEYYNDKRNQFELQYDHQAEIMLANLEFREDDSEQQRKIKYRIIQEYNRRLDKRNQIKEFVLEHRLLQDEYQKQMDRNRNQYEKQSFEELKPIARFTTLKEYNQLVRKSAFTKQLKSTIEGLRRIRRSHPTTYKNLQEFLNSQPEQSKPKKKNPNDSSVKTGKRVEEILQKQFKLNKRDFENLFQNLQANNGKKGTYKNVQAIMLQKNY